MPKVTTSVAEIHASDVHVAPELLMSNTGKRGFGWYIQLAVKQMMLIYL